MNLIKKLLCSVSAVAVSSLLVLPVMAADAQWKRNDKGWYVKSDKGRKSFDEAWSKKCLTSRRQVNFNKV